MTELTSLSYELGEHGWSALSLHHTDGVCNIRISHVFSDPMRNLANLGLALGESVPRAEVTLFDEPCGAKLLFVRNASRHDMYNLSIHDLKSNFGESEIIGSQILAMPVRRDEIVKRLWCELTKVRLLMAHKWYSNARGTYFPEEEYQLLTDLVANKGMQSDALLGAADA